MDTKLKKSKLYSQQAKIVAWIFVLLFTITGSAAMFQFPMQNISIGSSSMGNDSYFDTWEFSRQFEEHLEDVIKVNVLYKSEKNIKAGNAIQEDELIQDIANQFGINWNDPMFSQIIKSRSENLVDMAQFTITQEANSAETASDIGETQELYQEFIDYLNTEYPTYKKDLIQNQLDQFRIGKETLEQAVNFKFAVIDQKGTVVQSNESPEKIKEYNRNCTMDGPYISESSDLMLQFGLNSMYRTALEKGDYVLHAGVTDVLQPGDIFYTGYQNFENSRLIVPGITAVLIISILLAGIFALFLVITSGQNEKGGAVSLGFFDQIYNDIHTVFAGVTVGAFVFFAVIAVKEMRNGSEGWKLASYAAAILLFTCGVMVALQYTCSMSRQIKTKQLFRHTLFSRVLLGVASLFTGKTFSSWMAVFMIGYAAINAVIGSISGGIILFILFNLFCLYFMKRALRSLTEIMRAAKETSQGNINHVINLKTISPAFVNFAKDVANIQRGLKQAVNEAVKGERMKIDLIANVSHDLKTPLTSIITYVDLLKKEKLENDTAQGYVQVLDEKSNRLKQLIEDLIEASKASSGNISVNVEMVDLRQLVMQACGEFESKITQAQLRCIVNAQTDTFVKADGKQMWRILENLLSNAVKYSMPNTRVYIDILKTETQGIFVIKNISSQTIEVNPEQLTERFVRGDTSRTTEGSGLGLSIAQSLTDLQNGKMSLVIDGDLFKVCIQMPLWNQSRDGKERKTAEK